MSVGEKVSQFSDNVQNGIKSSIAWSMTISVKVISSLLISLTLALIAQTLIGFGGFSFLFFNVVSFGLLLRMMWNWRLGVTLIFNLFCVLIAILLRMYILLAPN